MVLPITGINEQFNAAFFTAGPTEKDGIVIHWWGLPQGQGIDSVRTTFGNGGRQASAHFGATDGEVDCYVNPDDVAWANGNWAANLSKISIECNPRQSDGDYYAAAWTIAYIRSIYGDLPLSRHWDYYPTQCCGTYDLERLDQLAYDIAATGIWNSYQLPTPAAPVVPAPPAPATQAKSIDQLAQEVIAGAYGTGDARRVALGGQYDAVQARVNEILTGVSNAKPQPSISELADRVMRGEFGNGDQRITALGNQYQEVQNEINRRAGISAPVSVPSAPNIEDLVRRTLAGEFGNGDDRVRALGANYTAVQAEINRRYA
ncbi:lysin A [Arthrobacter phage Nightmare]|uniref:Lysin A n=1 Tax=Arthrobacter phage Nightmare TaxID=2015864 RepID=A0A221J6E1_9CAUD|nr:lysin A [Arthrobacter phage Nightmare]ASM62279.1 lysin A [Arthrobacter phage Nightmare]